MEINDFHVNIHDGGTPYGLGSQQLDDASKHNIEQLFYIEPEWGAYMGRLIYGDCKVSLNRAMQLLNLFEKVGKKAEKENRFLSWTIPITNFPVVQHYTEGITKKVWVMYGPNKGKKRSTGYYSNALQLAVCFLEETKASKRKQGQGAAPNIIHSLDAAHMMLIVHRAPFPVSTVHDSFGALLCEMPELFKIVRETFVELYETEPLKNIMTQVNGDMSEITLGNLDIREILEAEYAFS